MRPLAALLLPLFLCAPAPGQNYTVYTFAGGGLPNNVPARSASLSSVVAVAVDAGGNMYIAASALNVIFRVDAGTGQLTRFAGNGTAGYSGDNGPAAGAKLSGPLAVAVDAAGNVYIADTYNNVIRKVSSGVITTIAGNGSGAGNATVGSGGYSGDGGPATSAQLNNPYGVAVDAGGSLYIADGFNNVIRKVSNGVISTFAGNGYGAGVGPVTGGYSGDNGQAVSAELDRPSGVAVDAAGSVYIADSGNNVVRLVSNGLITTVAGNGTLGSSGDNGPAISAQLFQPNSVAVDTAGNLYVSFFMGNTVRRITNGVITTVAGGGYQTGPEYNGPATNLESFDIECAAVDTAGNLYIADAGNNVIRKVAKGVISTVAGNGAPSYSGDNDPATSAELYIPQGVAVDTASDVYIADHGNNVVRMVSKGIITTIAGNGTGGYSGDVGLAASAQLNGPTGVAVDANGNLYIADAGNNVIREVSNGIITTLAGNGKAGYSGDNGPAASAQLSLPSGVAVDTAGNLHIADTGNQRVRKISNGLITTIAGNGASYQIGPSTTGGYSGDGGPATDAELNMPRGVAVDLSGNVYIDDASNGRIRKVTDGVITTVAGGGTQLDPAYSGPATSAALSGAFGIAVDTAGNLYIADNIDNAIRKVSNGLITTIAGNGYGAGDGTGGYSGDNGPATSAEFFQPAGVAVGSTGSVYVTDTLNNVIRVLVPGPLAAQAASLNAAGRNGSVEVTVPDGVAWSASSNTSWITITSGASSGTGSGSVSFSVQPDTGAARTGAITIAGETFTIDQQSASRTGLSLVGSMAQIASAGGWETSLTLVNLGAAQGQARLNFYGNDGSAPWLPFTFPQQASQDTTLGSTFDEELEGGAMLVLDTTGPVSQTSGVGSSQLLSTGAVNGFAVFKYTPTGQEAVVPLETRNAPSYLLAFDYSNGLQTGFALANVSASRGDVKVVVRDETGAVIPTKATSIPLDGDGHASFMLDDVAQGFPEIAGKRGTVEFDTPSSGQISVLGLRVNGNAITTLPVLAQVGTTGGALAHVATGAGWETLFTLVNTGASVARFTLNFYDEKTGVPLPRSLVFPQGGTAQTTSSLTQTLAPGATLLIQTQGGSMSVTCAAHLTTTGNVSGFAIFQIQSSGQEAVVPLETRTPAAFVLAYDNTNGLATGIALANLSTQAGNIGLVVRDDIGATIQTGQVQLVANGHESFMLTDPDMGFPVTTGKRGTVEIQTPSGGRISALGIRAVTATHVITTIPVLAK